MDAQEITHRIIGAAMVVHSELGAGLLESHYWEAMEVALEEAGLAFRRQVPVPVAFHGRILRSPKQIDLLVEDTVVVELKAVSDIRPWHVAQTLTYMKLSGCGIGLILNFDVASLRHGIKRLIISPDSSMPSVSSVANGADEEAG